MFPLQVSLYRALLVTRLMSPRHCSDQVFDLQRQLKEGEILLGYHCWQELADEADFETAYWSLRESRTRLERVQTGLTRAEQTLAALENEIRHATEHPEQDSESPRSRLPPKRREAAPDRSAAPQRRPRWDQNAKQAGPLEPLGGDHYQQLNEIRAEAREHQRRFKTVQTKLRVRREEAASDDEIRRLREDLASIRRQFDQCRRRLAILRRELPDSGALRAKSGAESGPESPLDPNPDRNPNPDAEKESPSPSAAGNPSPEKPARARQAATGRPRATGTNPALPVSAEEQQALDERRKQRRTARSEWETLRNEQARLLRQRDESFRQLGSLLRRDVSHSPHATQLRRRHRELIRRLNQLARDAATFSRLQNWA